MSDPGSNLLLVFVLGFVSSFFGALLGIGGGVFIVPALTLLLNLPIQVAAGSSLLTIIANSCTASYNYIKNELTNIRIGILLCCTIVPGAIAGSILVPFIPSTALAIFFCIIVLGLSYWMLKKPAIKSTPSREGKTISGDAGNRAEENLPEYSYFDKNLNERIIYRISGKCFGIISSFFAGLLSSLLGIGGGVINVPVMSLVMGIPIKVAVATSSFMIMTTAAAGAMVYYYNGYIYPVLVAPLIVGAIMGSMTGSAVLHKIRPGHLQRIFAGLAVVISIMMLLRVFKVI